ncbi:FAD/NAD(P)-binding oxidoreductase family protein isoform X2 [Wolffia australiana]
MMSTKGRLLRSFTFRDVDPSQEVRAVERKVLLEALASRLPPDSIRFSSKLKSITRGDDAMKTLLELEDGTQIEAKVVIGCDGVRSAVAKSMGFSEPKFVGHCAFRGLGEYPDGHGLQPKVNYVYGQGIRAGFVPVSPTKVYWFICFNSQDPGSRGREVAVLKREAAEMVAGWPSALGDVISRTPDVGILRTPLVDRWLWPGVSPAGADGGMVLAGDAWHPMTPNLGQGGCCALEDAAVLSAKLAAAVADGATSSVVNALADFCSERWWRVFPLTVRSNLVGSLLQWDNPFVCALRNEVVIPRLVMLGPFLEHTNYRVDFSQTR